MRNYRESLQNFAERQTTTPFQLYRTAALGRNPPLTTKKSLLKHIIERKNRVVVLDTNRWWSLQPKL